VTPSLYAHKSIGPVSQQTDYIIEHMGMHPVVAVVAVVEYEGKVGDGGWYSSHYYERSVGTVFQLPSPDAIYSRDEEKNGNVGGLSDCLGWRTAHMLPVEGVIEGRKRLGRWPSHMTSGSARYNYFVLFVEIKFRQCAGQSDVREIVVRRDRNRNGQRVDGFTYDLCDLSGVFGLELFSELTVGTLEPVDFGGIGKRWEQVAVYLQADLDRQVEERFRGL
jgi:hypothetical protein